MSSLLKHTHLSGILALALGTPGFSQELEPIELAPLEVIGLRVPDFQSAPLTATVLSGDDVADRDINSPQDIASVIPNLASTDTGTRSYGDVFAIRGLTNTPFFSSPSVTLYVDDIPFGDVYSYAHQLNGVALIDIFRGPQHTVFGRYSYGGVIDIHSRRPGDFLEGSTSIKMGTESLLEWGGTLMGPISESLSFRLGGFHNSRDGFIRNELTGGTEDTQRHGGGNLALFYAPDIAWDISLHLSVDQSRDGAPRLNSLDAMDPWVVRSDVDSILHRDANSQALRIAYDTGDFEILSVTARRDWDLDPYRFDLDFSEFPFGAVEIRQSQRIWSQELRIRSLDHNRSWDWSGGVYFQDNVSDHDGLRNFLDPSSGFEGEEHTVYSLDERQYAAFGEISTRMHERWRFHVGARIDFVEKEMKRSKTSNLALVPDASYEDDYTHFGPRLGAEYLVNPQTTAYFSTSYAFKPGGFSGFVDTPELAAHEEETTWATEVGVKWESENKQTRVNVAGFYYDIDDYQIERSFNVVDYAVFNAADANSYGIEVEANHEIAPGLDVIGSIGFTHVELDSYTDPVSGTNLDGNTAPFVPEFDALVGLHYVNDSGYFARVEYLAKGDTYFDDTNSDRFVEEQYGILNASAGVRGEKWELAFFGSNLTDEFFHTNKSPDANSGAPGLPQQFGVRFSIGF